ncbi:hypothetical protein TNCV_4372611 [Trichonephila clavipes]|nr:hypothetical protein TNCV_4372611 [Trichonephila clavipes]
MGREKNQQCGDPASSKSPLVSRSRLRGYNWAYGSRSKPPSLIWNVVAEKLFTIFQMVELRRESKILILVLAAYPHTGQVLASIGRITAVKRSTLLSLDNSEFRPIRGNN